MPTAAHADDRLQQHTCRYTHSTDAEALSLSRPSYLLDSHALLRYALDYYRHLSCHEPTCMLSTLYCADTQTDAAWAGVCLHEEILHASSWTYTSTRREAPLQANTPVPSSLARMGFESSEAICHPGACWSLHPASCEILRTLQTQVGWGWNSFLTDNLD